MKIHRVLNSFRASALAGLFLAGIMAHAADAPKTVLPWQREAPLKEAARTAVLSSTLDPNTPGGGMGARFTISNTQVRSSLWGPSNRLTLSIMKTDVWDRRVKNPDHILTLAEIREGAFSPANKGFDDMPPNQRRPVRGWLPPQGGGRVDPYATWNAYPFPCQKPVGQIILGLDELAGIDSPGLTQSCADGSVRMQLKNEKAQADLQILLSMTRNVYAIRGQLTGAGNPWLRLYRHEDQAWCRYMLPDKKTFRERTPGSASGKIGTPNPGQASNTQTLFDYAKDKDWNGLIEPPTSGSDGKYFWIHQKLPAEKTFPKGFDYVLMGVLVGKDKIETVDGKKGLGTPPTGTGGDRLEDGYSYIRQASGSAATAAWDKTQIAKDKGQIEAYVTVVTCNDAADPMAEARHQLDAAFAEGYDKLAAENKAWYDALYDHREDGRVFTGNAGTSVTDSIPEIFGSWRISHGGTNQPDMRRYEATASYANLEQDWQLWHSLPCYNEIFYTANFVRNRADSASLWWKIIEAWMPAAKKNARQVYGVQDGMVLLHGYIPPIKPDAYVHTNVFLEYSFDTMAQIVRPLWEEWDYGGNEQFLRQHAYPAMREAAQFFANYAKKGDDGLYHYIPSAEAEAWGIFPEFRRARDTISCVCMARWTFQRAAEAAKYLNVDADLSRQWLEIAAKLPAYPMYDTPDGPIFNSVAETVPSHKQGDHPWYIGHYPTTLADEVNLDSSQELKDAMARTARQISTSQSGDILTLLGIAGGAGGGRRGGPGAGGSRGGRGGLAPEALLNSRSGRIHLFPATPANQVVAFHHFQARGAFLVSAAKDAGGVTYVEIEARKDGPCQLMNPWPGAMPVVRDQSGAKVEIKIDKSNGECLIIPARKGSSYVVQKPQAS